MGDVLFLRAISSALQSQKAETAYVKSKQLLPFGLEGNTATDLFACCFFSFKNKVLKSTMFHNNFCFLFVFTLCFCFLFI